MCLILDGYGDMTVFSFPYTPSCEPRLSPGEPLRPAGQPASQLKPLRATRAVHNRAAACLTVDGGIFENQL
jgi:hypothetical protein